MAKMWNIWKQTAATTLLLLFVAYYLDVNCFVHSHIVNGVTIVHSHIHRDSHHDTDNGGHTTTAINLIAHLCSQFLTTENHQQEPDLILPVVDADLACEQDASIVPYHLRCTQLRAPPYKA